MTNPITNSRYTGMAITLHWLSAIAVIGAFAIGLYASDLPVSPQKLKLYSWHKWIGVTIFLLTLARLAWRSTHPAPTLPGAMKRWEIKLANTSHALLYLLLAVIPLTGWLMSSATGFPVVYFGVLPLPDLLGKDKTLAETLKLVHEGLNWTLFALVLLHAAAALKHHFHDRDGVLTRMLPRS